MPSNHFPPLSTDNVGKAGVQRGGKFIDIEVYGTAYIGGTVTLGGDMVVAGSITLDGGSIEVGDIESSNWGGASPANLTARDTSGTPAGYYLDDSLGAAQFEGDVFVGGDILLAGKFETATSGSRIEIDTDTYGSNTIRLYSNMQAEQTPGQLRTLSIYSVGVLDRGSVILSGPNGGDSNNSGTGTVTLSSDDVAEQSQAVVETATDGTYEAVTTIQANSGIPDGTGDATVNITATSDDGDATIALSAHSNGSGVSSIAFNADSLGGPSLEWQTWSPTLVNITQGNGTLDCRQSRVGDTVHLYFEFTLGSTSSIGAGPRVEYPVTPRDEPSGTGQLRDTGTLFYPCTIYHSASDMKIGAHTASGTYGGITQATASIPFTWTTGDQIIFNITYEAA